jgi:endonuclease/exonuclease/phosphatase family metal-dependent hydrolase
VTLRLLSYNIRHGGAGREGRLASVIRDCEPDLVVFQEATRPQVVERLAAETGLPVWAARAGDSVAFISRVGVESYAWHPLIRPGRGFMEIVLAEPKARVYGVHLSAVHSNWTERRRRRELDLMLRSVAHDREEFHVFAGDFNTLAPGEMLDTRKLPPRLRALVWLSGGRVRYETVQTMLDAGYVDGYRVMHTSDAGYTFPVWDPHVRLDFAFFPARFSGRLEECRVMSEVAGVREASDHFPLLARLSP